MKKAVAVAVVFLGALSSPSQARDLGILSLPVHQGKWTSSVLYEYSKVRDDFDSRGRADFTSSLVGAQFGYGITDQLAVAVKGGALVDPQEEAQGSRWESRAGYLYGMDLYNEVFPATAVKPGVELNAGVSGFLIPLDRTNVGGRWQAVDQRMSGVEYHGAVLGTLKWGKVSPYAGVRGFGNTVEWRDDNPGSGAASITGHAHGNISLVVGAPVQLTQEVRMQVEGRFVNETAATVGFTIAAF